jgi:hypothetical protein
MGIPRAHTLHASTTSPAFLFFAGSIFLLLAAAPTPLEAEDLPPEIQAGGRTIIDFEFDWGRDGIHCPACNYGTGNDRLAWVDLEHQLWVAHVDPESGLFYPGDGRGTLVDSNVTTAQEIGNGPEWMASQQGSQLVYTRWTDGLPHYVPYLTLGFARLGDSAWLAGSIEGSEGLVLPVGSQDFDDPYPTIHYQGFSSPGSPASMYWLDLLPGAEQHALPIYSDVPGMTRRWVPGTRDIVITAPPLLPVASSSRAGFRQVFMYHTATGKMEELTSSPEDKFWAFMWRAPEFNNETLFFAMEGGSRLNIYRRSTRNGPWLVIESIDMPADTPYMSSPEPFVFNGLSYIFFTLSAERNGRLFSPSRVAITGILPGNAMPRMLTSLNSPSRSRRDPEFFITPRGPLIYYNRYLPETVDTGPVSEGVYYVDAQLGPPVR